MRQLVSVLVCLVCLISAFVGCKQQPGATSGAGSGATSSSQLTKEEFETAIREITAQLRIGTAEYERLASSDELRVEFVETQPAVAKVVQISWDLQFKRPYPVDAIRQLQSSRLAEFRAAVAAARTANKRFTSKYRPEIFSTLTRDQMLAYAIEKLELFYAGIQRDLPIDERLSLARLPGNINTKAPSTRSADYGLLHSLGFKSTDYLPISFDRQSRMEQDAEEVIPWQVEVDAGSLDSMIPADARLDIEVPFANLPSRSVITQPIKILYPAMPSRFVALELNDLANQQRQVWDLADRKRVGVIKGLQLQGSPWVTLSPDGKYFAGQPQGTSLVGLWDVDAAKPVAMVTLPFQGEPSLLEFAADNRVVVIHGETLLTLKVPSGEIEHQLDIGKTKLNSPFSPGSFWGMSPGGRYLALPRDNGKSVVVVDLTTGQKTGRVDVSFSAGGGAVAVDFTHNGQKLAIVGGGAFKTVIQVWDIARGEIETSFTFEEGLRKIVEGNRKYQGPAVDWLPGDSRLLINGRGIFNTESGTMETILPAAMVYHLQPFADGQLLVANGTKLAAFNLAEVNSAPLQAERESFTVAKTSPEKMPTPQASEESSLLALTSVDRSQTAFRDLSSNDRWSVEADPGPAVSATDVRERLTVSTSQFPFVVTAVLSADGGRAAVGYASRNVTVNRGVIPFLPPLASSAKSSSPKELAAMSSQTRIAALQAQAMNSNSINGGELTTAIEHFNPANGGKHSVLTPRIRCFCKVFLHPAD